MKKYVNSRVFKATATKLEKEFGKETTGVSYAAEIYIPLSRQLHEDVKGKFSENELKALVNNHSGSTPDFQFTGKNFLITHCENAEKFEAMSEKWGISLNDLIDKIESCSNAGVFYLQAEIFRFWSDKTAYNEDLETFIKAFG